MSQNREEGEDAGAIGSVSGNAPLVVASIPRRVASRGNVRVAIDRVTSRPGEAVPLHAYSFTWPAVGRGVERSTLPLAIPTTLPDGTATLTSGVTPEALITAALDAYVRRAEQATIDGDDVTQRARLVNAVGLLRAALTEIGVYTDGGDGYAPLETPSPSPRG